MTAEEEQDTDLLELATVILRKLGSSHGRSGLSLADDAVARVRADGESVHLPPLSPYERKIVHDAVAAVDGVHSESEGVEPSRRVVVLVD